MRAHCITIRDPFHPARGRETREIHATGPIRALAPKTDRPFIILRNGDAMLRRDWDKPVNDGDVVAVVYLAQGGKGGSNPLQMILMIAVTVFAPYAGQFVAGQMGATLATGSMALSAVNAASIMVGMALVNAIIPPPKPPSTHQAASLAAPSPTYNLQAQGNMARLDGAIPEQFGRECAFPDFAALPYAEFAGNEQYLYQLLCLGRGEFDIEAIRIEDTPISSFSEIDYEVVPPGGTVTKFPSNVFTSGEVSGQELPGKRSGTYSQTGTTLTVTLAGHGLSPGRTVYLDITSGAAADGAYTVQTIPTVDTLTVTAASATTSGNVDVTVYLGPYVASAPDTAANTLGIDFVAPRGLYHAKADGTLEVVSATVEIQARQIDNDGAPTGSWVSLGTETLSDRTTTPQRISRRYGVSGGRYEVRARRTDTKQTDTTYGHEVIWGGLRAYLPETRVFGDVTLIAMRMRASNNLSMQASRKINVICTRKLPIWNGTAWSAPTATSSIAWALAYACRTRLPDSRIDLDALLTLDATWAARGDEFNGRFDGTISFWEALTKIAQAGRAKPFIQGGIVRFVRDQAQTIPVALYSMRNISRGSFSISYIMPSEDTADSLSVAYRDANYWAPRRVPAALPDSTSAKPAKIETFGVTSRQQAFNEGMYQAASNRYRRRLIKFGTEMEGYIPSFGDLIAIQHDMPAWGQHAEAVAWDAETQTLTLSEPMTWGTGTHYIGLRRKDGSMAGPYIVTAGASSNEVVLDSTPSPEPYTGSQYERTHVTFGWGETWRQLAKVIGVKPRGLYSVEIEAINEDPSVHTAELGLTAPPVQTSQLTSLYTAPVVDGLTMRSSPADNQKALLTWTPAPGAGSYQVEMAAGSNPYAAGVSWTRVAETSANNFAVTAIYGAETMIRVRAIGMTVGPWVNMFFGGVADYLWQPAGDPMWTPSGDLMWG